MKFHPVNHDAYDITYKLYLSEAHLIKNTSETDLEILRKRLKKLCILTEDLRLDDLFPLKIFNKNK